jgi:subtilisin family serine protease
VVRLPIGQVRDWAFADATGAGVTVAVVDSGVDADHPRVGGVAGAVAFELDPTVELGYVEREGPHEDLVGHGTACAAIIRSLAPEAELYSVRVLGANLKGRGALLHAGVQWSVEHHMQVANLSLSSKSEAMFGPLHEVADDAYFAGTVLVCAANNLPGPTYPSQYASVVSVAARPGEEEMALAYNAHPPVEFGARGIDVDVAWAGHGSITATGNSFAAPHVAGMVALMRSKHPWLSPLQVKAVLQAASVNSVSG